MITDIYAEVRDKGISYDFHCSDLYIPVNKETRELVSSYEYYMNVTIFYSDDEAWFEIPFAYNPHWDKAWEQTRTFAETSFFG